MHVCYSLWSHNNLSSIVMCLQVQKFHFKDDITFFLADILFISSDACQVLTVDKKMNLNISKMNQHTCKQVLSAKLETRFAERASECARPERVVN